MGLFSSLISLLLVATTVVECWRNNANQPKRDTGAVHRGFADLAKGQNILLNVGATYSIGKILLGAPKASLAASDVAAPSMLGQRCSSMDSQAYQPGLKLKDVYYPSW